MKRNIEINGLGPVLEIPSGSSESIQISPGKVRVNEGDAWYVFVISLLLTTGREYDPAPSCTLIARTRIESTLSI